VVLREPVKGWSANGLGRSRTTVQARSSVSTLTTGSTGTKITSSMIGAETSCSTITVGSITQWPGLDRCNVGKQTCEAGTPQAISEVPRNCCSWADDG
jgi:hypothetical protein